jgi:ADP-ribose pyrophosphatase YjhB (NUDIX family)
MYLAARLIHRLNLIRWFFTHPLSLGVRTLITQGDQVLLVRHTYQDQWFLPGGGVKKRETLEQAARREAREEAGAELGALRLFGAYSTFQEYKNDHVVVFLCTEYSTSPQKSSEIAEARCFPLHELPSNTSPGSRRRINEYLSNQYPFSGNW